MNIATPGNYALAATGFLAHLDIKLASGDSEGVMDPLWIIVIVFVTIAFLRVFFMTLVYIDVAMLLVRLCAPASSLTRYMDHHVSTVHTLLLITLAGGVLHLVFPSRRRYGDYGGGGNYGAYSGGGSYPLPKLSAAGL